MIKQWLSMKHASADTAVALTISKFAAASSREDDRMLALTRGDEIQGEWNSWTISQLLSSLCWCNGCKVIVTQDCTLLCSVG